MPQSAFPKPLYLGAATRSPIGKFGGALKRFAAGDLAALALKEAVKRAPEAKNPDYVFLGHARQAGAGPNPARQAAIFGGLPESVPAVTYNQACASGLASILAAVEKIALGRAASVWAGGVESMSNTPYLLTQARWGQRMGHGQVVDGMSKDGFFCPMSQMLMGETVDNVVIPEFKVTREEQDAFALRSQKNAEAAWTAGAFNAETFEIPAEGKNPGLKDDEHRRGDSTLESLAKLAPVFSKTGTVTAGNSSGIVDGAAWVHVSDVRGAHAMAEILDYEVVAIDPKRMGVAPVPAVQALFKRQGLTGGDIEAYEINEAFAGQVIACQRTLKLPEEKINARGGSIALGHPIGATGTRITVTLAHRLKGKPGALGVATLCVSGGMGVALLIRAL
jgi:acetyl-CoA C-acetyltransferase